MIETREPRDRYFAADQAPFEVETRLSAISMAVRPEGMISREVCPVVDAGAPVFSYSKEKIRERFALHDVRIGRASRPTQIEVGATNTDSRVLDYGLEGVVPRRDRYVQRAQGAGRDPLGRASESVTGLVRLAEEKRVADLVTSIASYATGHSETVAGNSRWNRATATPLDEIVKQADKMLLRPNVLVMGQEVWTGIRKQGQILEATKMTGAGKDEAAGLAKLDALREELQIRRILVGSAWADTANAGQAAAVWERLWGPHAALLYVDPDLVDLEDQGATFCFAATWMASEGVVVYYEQSRGAYGADIVRLVEPRREIVAYSELGYLWRDAVDS